MSVIRSLTSSRDSADRDRERLELEKGFQQCDVKLDEMITEHSNDLYQVMANFSKILNNLSRAKERLIDTRDKLLSCQKLLHCKRDELKKLWFEIVENRAVFNLLERIEQISLLPRQVDSYAEKKHYLHAAQCCIDGLSQLGNNFSSNQERIRSPCPISIEHCNSLGKIDALSEIRVELLAKKEMLFDKCIDELHRHLYQSATDNIRKTFQEQYQSRLAKTDVEINQISSVIYDLSKGKSFFVLIKQINKFFILKANMMVLKRTIYRHLLLDIQVQMESLVKVLTIYNLMLIPKKIADNLLAC